MDRNEQRIIEWLTPIMSSLLTDDKLLMIGLFCMTNYNQVSLETKENKNNENCLYF